MRKWPRGKLRAPAADKRAIGQERPVGGEHMHVRVEVGQVPEGLHKQDQPRARTWCGFGVPEHRRRSESPRPNPPNSIHRSCYSSQPSRLSTTMTMATATCSVATASAVRVAMARRLLGVLRVSDERLQPRQRRSKCVRQNTDLERLRRKGAAKIFAKRIAKRNVFPASMYSFSEFTISRFPVVH